MNETARLTDQRAELDDEMKEKLSKRINLLQENLATAPVVEITYFVPDERKEGGTYSTATGTIKKIDKFQRIIVLTDGTDIPIDEIAEINGAMFRSLDDSFA
ncbi:MAG: YolD-like family protein [Clostridiales bacterium]|nr:YolD-like family protein [Clostridiales bacterium]